MGSGVLWEVDGEVIGEGVGFGVGVGVGFVEGGRTSEE